MKNFSRLLKSSLVILMLLSLLSSCNEDEPNGSSNSAPTVADQIADFTLAEGFGTESISLSDVFSDADGDDLTFTATSSDEEVATVAVSGSTLTLTEVGNGTTTISVSAEDGDGDSVSDSFVVEISSSGSTNQAPTVANVISNQSLNVGFGSATVELANVFEDADNDDLTLTVVSEDESIVTVSIDGTTLTLTEVGAGSTNVTVTATDPSDATVSDTFEVEVSESNTSTDIFSFSNQNGNSLTIDSWTAMDDADGYVIIINTEDSFTDLTDGDDLDGSTSYNGVGEQLIYNGTSIVSLDLTILEQDKSYYFKLVPYSGSHIYDNQYDAEEGSTSSCSYSSTTISQVCFSISGDLRTISSNQYPSHDVGTFPNADPTAIESTHDLDLTPEKAASVTYVYDETGGPTPSNDNFYQFGVAVNGVEFHPMGLKPWENPDDGEENWEWQAKVTEENDTGLDAYGAHVTTAGNYHYHGDIVALADEEDGSRHSLIYGFAADGFPIYYKYGYSDENDGSSSIKELLSSYQLRSGSRPGDGSSAPDGTYDGTYIQDFEYVEDLGDLDECNGRTGVTPEYPDGTYYYVITADFPVTPNCFAGTPDDAWKIGK
ncbi:MAG: YHYH protein [Reichenbachiella sp.]|uniref:YHYH protein n=1 Tax=Reichenbachiella sp. TaxID=2184521 RepID=UPI0032652E3C